MPRLVPIEEEEKLRLVPAEEPTTAMQAFGRNVLNPVADAITGIPDLALTAGARLATGVPMFAEHSVLPAVGERVIPGIPSGEQAVSGLFAGAQGLGALAQGEAPQFRQRFDEQMALNEQMSEQHPVAAGAGDLVGQGTALALGRRPIARGASRAPRNPAARVSSSLTPGLKRSLDDVMRSEPMQRMLRGVGRATETSFEGAMLSALQEGDPLEAGALAAGQQLGGSLALEGFRQIRRHPIIASVGSAAAILQIAKQTTPGGRDRILESIESGFDKIILASVLGLAAGAAGSGRISGSRLAESHPFIIDAITAVPRGAMLGLVRDFWSDQDEGLDTTERAMAHMMATPQAFKKRHLDRLQHAMRTSDVSFSQVVQDLERKDRDFALLMDSPVGLAHIPRGVIRR